MADTHELKFGMVGPALVDGEASLVFGQTFIWDLTQDNPTDEDCAFCDVPEVVQIQSLFDAAIPLAGGVVALKGALGMMRPGYMLGVSREHTTSFARLGAEALAEIDDAFSEVETKLRAALGHSDYVRLEHGSDNVDACGLGAGSCVVHAHQHLIPATIDTAGRLLQQTMPWQELDDYSQLAELAGEPYLYVGAEGKHYAIPNPKVKSQWGRRIVAEEDGHQDWDWALFSGSMNLVQTWVSLGMLPHGRLVVSANLGSESSARILPRLKPRGLGQYK